MQENLRVIEEIKVRQEKLNGEALQLQQDMLDFRDEFQKQIQAVCNCFGFGRPLTFHATLQSLSFIYLSLARPFSVEKTSGLLKTGFD